MLYSIHEIEQKCFVFVFEEFILRFIALSFWTLHIILDRPWPGWDTLHERSTLTEIIWVSIGFVFASGNV